MGEKRKDTRYESTAKVIIEGISKEEGVLKDISVTGCRINLANYIEIKPHTQFKLKIIPEEASEIDSFHLAVENKWVGTEVDSFVFGFGIIKSPEGKQFGRYVDYLSWRYSQGSSMIGDNGLEIL
jgi:hypothetical protein